MDADDQMIAYLEALSFLTLNDAERQSIKKDLTKVLNYIDTLNELDTLDVEALSHPFSFSNFFREDEVRASFERQLILDNAPDKKREYFRVPRTVE